jgi:transposase-like protein
MKTKRPIEQAEQLARYRAALIVQVQCGQITVQEAANQLGVSRKTYYEWEKRASQRDRPGGRPAQPQDPEKQALQEQAQQLQDQARLLEQTLVIRQQVAELERSKKNS